MRTALAEQLLVKIMDWSPEEVQRERAMLQSLANFKYDEYQQYSQGMRFIESLVRWLGQFLTYEERNTAYQFIKSKLIFISGEQVLHLVGLAYSHVVRPVLLRKTASELQIDKMEINRIVSSQQYKDNKRKTLFIGLSDGSRIDHFRRSARINNEQILPTYEISKIKADDLIEELKKDSEKDRFNSVFLVDDFTASGKSYCRFEAGEAKGKVLKFLERVFNPPDDQSHYSNLVSNADLTINLLFYIATKDALAYIEKQVHDWSSEFGHDVKFEVTAIQVIEGGIEEGAPFLNLCANETYFDPTIIDRHYKKGTHEFPYLGFNQCALPLVLNHNTPNNSLPVLWLQEDRKFVGLFPRVTRHKE